MVCESACLLVYVTKMYLHNRRRTLEDFKTKKEKKKKKKKEKHKPSEDGGDSWEHQTGRFFFSTEKHLILFLLIPMSDFSGTYIMYGLCWKRKHALPNLCYIHTLRNKKRLPKNVPLSQICERALLQKENKRASLFDCHSHLGQFSLYI